MPSQSLPDGVERYKPAAKADPQERGFIGIPSPDGEFVRLSDLPKIEEQVRRQVREELRPAVSAMAAISAATGRARLVQENPDLDGFTVDEELDEISAHVSALRESLATLDNPQPQPVCSTCKGSEWVCPECGRAKPDCEASDCGVAAASADGCPNCQPIGGIR